MIDSNEAVAVTAAEPQSQQRLASRPNELLRSARRARRSPSGSGRVLSRQELADACNQILDAMYAEAGRTRRWAGMTALYIGALERGEVRWPNEDYRAALRAFFNATDVELGLFIDRPERQANAATAGALSGNGEPESVRACAHCAGPGSAATPAPATS